MIGIIDYKIGNFGSLLNAFAYLSVSAAVIDTPEDLGGHDAIVLPGVGAFDAAMTTLRQSGFADAIKDFAEGGKPVLGICLGLQVLCNASEEGSLPGLGLVDGRVESLKKLGCTGKTPHVGFNSVEATEGDSAFLKSLVGTDYYFIHSFALHNVAAPAADIALAYTEYEGVRIISALQRDNVFATQFHPEKSGEAGLALLKSFLLCSKSD